MLLVLTDDCDPNTLSGARRLETEVSLDPVDPDYMSERINSGVFQFGKMV